MPNDCWNLMTVTGTKEDIDRFFLEELKNEVPDYPHKIYRRGVEGLDFRIWSPWHPNFEWLEKLFSKYPSIWVKNMWHEEGGLAGIWIGSLKDGIKRFDWEDMCIEEEAHRFRSISC